jgi:hypothetical protein
MKLLLLVPFLLAIALFNWRVDPACLFVPSYEEEVVALLLQGKNVAGPRNYDIRRQHVLYAEGLKKPKDFLILGSSRSYGIVSSFFDTNSLYNASVSSCILKDYVGIYGVFRRQDLLPKTLVLGAEPWFFNHKNPRTTDATPALEADYQAMIELLGIQRQDADGEGEKKGIFPEMDPRLRKYLELISPAYFQHSLKSQLAPEDAGPAVSKQTPKTDAKHCREAVPPEEPMRYADGSAPYGKGYNNRPPTDALVDAARMASPPISYVEDYASFDPDLVEEFERLVDRMQQDKVSVVFFLPPLHPLLYTKVSTTPQYQRVVEAERYFRNYAQQKGISVCGSYDPQVCGVESTDFVDGWHLRNEGFAKIFRPEKTAGVASTKPNESLERNINEYCTNIKTWYELRQAYLKNPQALALFDKKARELLANFPERPAGLEGVKLVGFEWTREKTQTATKEALYRVNCLIRVETPPVLAPGTSLAWAVYGKVQEKDRNLFQGERFRKNGQFDLGIPNIPCQTWQAGDYYLISRTMSQPDVPYQLSFRFAIQEAGGKSIAQPVVELGDSAQYSRQSGK